MARRSRLSQRSGPQPPMTAVNTTPNEPQSEPSTSSCGSDRTACPHRDRSRWSPSASAYSRRTLIGMGGRGQLMRHSSHVLHASRFRGVHNIGNSDDKLEGSVARPGCTSARKSADPFCASSRFVTETVPAHWCDVCSWFARTSRNRPSSTGITRNRNRRSRGRIDID
jgi:hypothetical protein